MSRSASRDETASKLPIEKHSSYADAVSSNLTNIGKLAVASTFKEQKKEDHGKATIVLYGVVEDGNVVVCAHNILSTIYCNFQAIS